MLDSNNDGILEEQEIIDGMQKFKDYYKHHLGNDKKEPDWSKLIECLKVSESGGVEWGEFVTAASNRYRLLMDDENLKTVFEIMDKDGSGDISIDELKECFSYDSGDKLNLVDEALWDKMLEEIDEDKNGQISFEEFRSHMLKMIDLGNFDLRPHIIEAVETPKASKHPVTMMPEVQEEKQGDSDIDNSSAGELGQNSDIDNSSPPENQEQNSENGSDIVDDSDDEDEF